MIFDGHESWSERFPADLCYHGVGHRRGPACHGRQPLRRAKWNARGLGLFDHLVGSSKKRGRYGEAECLGCLEIDDQFKLGRLKHRHLRRFLAL
jgi:hypothetical protein